MVVFQDQGENLASIYKDEFQINIKYNEELQGFLKQILTQKGIEKIRLFRKSKYRTYASIAGLKA